MGDRHGVDIAGEGLLGNVDKREFIIRIYYMKKVILDKSNKRKI